MIVEVILYGKMVDGQVLQNYGIKLGVSFVYILVSDKARNADNKML
jgi:hypothetical protein